MKFVLYAPLAVALLLLPQLASADVPNPCKDDREKLCKDMKSAELHNCMKQHEAELSQACTAHRLQREEVRKIVIQACKDDIQKFCPDGGVAQGGPLKCLAPHSAEAQPACQEAIKQMPPKSSEERSRNTGPGNG